MWPGKWLVLVEPEGWRPRYEKAALRPVAVPGMWLYESAAVYQAQLTGRSGLYGSNRTWAGKS